MDEDDEFAAFEGADLQQLNDNAQDGSRVDHFLGSMINQDEDFGDFGAFEGVSLRLSVRLRALVIACSMWRCSCCFF